VASDGGDDEIVSLDPETAAMLACLRSLSTDLAQDFSVPVAINVAIGAGTISKLRILAQREDDEPDNSEMLHRLIHRAHRKMRAGLA
jgi:hypothetical protein